MNLDNYYLYATEGFRGDTRNKHNILSILKDKEIKTRESLGLVKKVYNRNNEICLCDVTLSQDKKENIEYTSAFEEFVLYGPTLVLSKNIKVYQPQLLETKKAKFPNTDMYDEVRHIGNISLENLEFIVYPIYRQQFSNTIGYGKILHSEYLKYFYEELKVIKKMQKKIIVKDIYTGENITPSDVKLFMKDCKKN